MESTEPSTTKPPCNCFAKREQQKQEERISVFCMNCSEALIGLNGLNYPVHVVPVRVMRKQYEAWLEQGYELTINE